MPRLAKRTKPEPPANDDATVGRALQQNYKKQNEENADTLHEGDAVNYYDEGWRYGKIEKLPEADEPRYGQVRVVHQMTGRVWVEARDVFPITRSWEEYFKWRRT